MPLVVHVAFLDHVGEPQRRGPRTAVVVREPEVLLQSAADAQLDARRAGHPHRLVEGHRDLDGLFAAVGVDRRLRRRGDLHIVHGGRFGHVGHGHGDGLVGRHRTVAHPPGGGDGHHIGVVPTGVGGVFVVGRDLERQNAAGRVDLEPRLVRAAGDGIGHRVHGVGVLGHHRAGVRLVLFHREGRGAGERRRVVGDGLVGDREHARQAIDAVVGVPACREALDGAVGAVTAVGAALHDPVTAGIAQGAALGVGVVHRFRTVSCAARPDLPTGANGHRHAGLPPSRGLLVPVAVVEVAVVVGHIGAAQPVDGHARARRAGVVPGIDVFGAAEHPEGSAEGLDVRMAARLHQILNEGVVDIDVRGTGVSVA